MKSIISAKAIIVAAGLVTIVGGSSILISSSGREITKVEKGIDMASELEDIYASPIIQINGLDTFEYESLEDAVILSEYDTAVIVQSILYDKQVDGFSFEKKE